MLLSKHVLGAFAVCAGLALLLGSRSAQAGRIGGPASQAFTVLPYQSVYVDVFFQAAGRAVVSVEGNGSSVLNLYVYDGDGHEFQGLGYRDRKSLAIDVYKAGVFRIEVRNLGQWSNSFILSTN